MADVAAAANAVMAASAAAVTTRKIPNDSRRVA
jgi:hypothetical protein